MQSGETGDRRFITAEDRIEWIREYDRIRSVPEVCRKHNISRKTFYKWLKRYRHASGSPESLADISRRPHRSPRATPQIVIDRLKELREKTGFGQKRLQLYLSIWFDMNLSESTIWKLLKRSGADMGKKRPSRRRLRPNDPLLPGDRVLIFFKPIEQPIGDHQYVQYSAIDECTRLRVTKIYGRHSTLSALDFVQYILQVFPFHIRYMHTPLDSVFTSSNVPRSRTHAFTLNLRKLGIKHEVPTKKQVRLTPYLERMRRLDEIEPYCSRRFASLEDLQREAAGYLHRYNNERPIPQIENMTPVERLRSFAQYAHLESFDPYTQWQ